MKVFFSFPRYVGEVGCTCSPLFYGVFSAVPLVAICNTSKHLNMTRKLPISSFFSWRYLSKVTKKNGMMEKKRHFGGHKSSMDCESSQGICALTHLMLWLSKKRQSYFKKKSDFSMLIANSFSIILKAGYVFLLARKTQRTR